ncbi:2-hydroxyacid dehydrogenase [Roseomonas populi]|uniref:2-hydroxyacid dehydrogenase n=1 Tax=Roseomonas populi TaxID=3121582 RepID=A0ABT1X3X6_9PROT|nr:2-hydroxyacid dehydrogenase [Roseomonas pecuniae]MCR0982806.1 2-hydroxyacid dehydrogenase [Roseomonas pecuniae]
MRALLVGAHAPQAPRLQALLGHGHEAVPVASLPASGPIVADVLVSTRLTLEEGARLQGCRLVQVPGAGLDGIAEGAVPAGVPICNVFEHEIPIAEYVIFTVLAHVLALHELPAKLDAKGWAEIHPRRPFHGEAAGRTMTLVGFGHIGKEVAGRARALGMRIVAVTRSGRPDALADSSLPVSRLREVLPETDVLVLCCPLDESTRGLVGAAELAAMKPTAFLVNVARAEVLDEQAAYEALRDRRIAGAAIDVWYRYPKPGEAECPPSRFPFHELPNLRATPHISGWSEGLMPRRYAFIAENIRALETGRPLRNVVRPPG